MNTYSKETEIQPVFSFVQQSTERQPDSIHLHTDYAASIVRWFANYCNVQCSSFQNHYEAQIRSLTSFCLTDLLVPTMKRGREWKRERQEKGGLPYMAQKKWKKEGWSIKERDENRLNSPVKQSFIKNKREKWAYEPLDFFFLYQCFKGPGKTNLEQNPFKLFSPTRFIVETGCFFVFVFLPDVLLLTDTFQFLFVLSKSQARHIV